MRLAFQIPKPCILEYSMYEDFHFALAHEVLQDAKYARIYRRLAEQDFVLLDNGVHENAEPLRMPDLFRAAWLCDASAMIPPDYFFDANATLRAFEEALDLVGDPTRLWPVIQGRTLGDLMTCYAAYVAARVQTICIPYRIGSEMRTRLIPYLDKRHQHHFLGYNTLTELTIIAHAPNPSLDTGKPFRYAQHGRRLFAEKPDAKLDMNQKPDRDTTYFNLKILKDFANGLF